MLNNFRSLILKRSCIRCRGFGTCARSAAGSVAWMPFCPRYCDSPHLPLPSQRPVAPAANQCWTRFGQSQLHSAELSLSQLQRLRQLRTKDQTLRAYGKIAWSGLSEAHRSTELTLPDPVPVPRRQNPYLALHLLQLQAELQTEFPTSR